MSKNKLISIVVFWVLLTLFNYYYMVFFLIPFVWLILVITLFINCIFQIKSLIKEKQSLSKLRVQYVLAFITLFLLTFFKWTTDSYIEKIDWLIFFNKRSEIVEQVKQKRIKLNLSSNGNTYELPFEFPVISNGGNEIDIYSNKENGKTTISFWIFRNYMEAPSSLFVYTDDPNEINEIDKKIKNNPIDNWKIKDNWYRILDR